LQGSHPLQLTLSSPVRLSPLTGNSLTRPKASALLSAKTNGIPAKDQSQFENEPKREALPQLKLRLCYAFA